MSKVQSVDKALRLLQALDSQDRWTGVRELARLVGLTPPTTHNLLQTLRGSGFVEFDPDSKHYRLGLAAIRLGAGADPLNGLRGFARPYIEAFAAEFQETIAVLAWADDKAVAVDWIQAEHPLAVTHNHGVVERPILLASGRLLLAYQDRATQLRYAGRERFENPGPNMPRNVDEFIQLMDQIRADGYAIGINVAGSGIAAVAAPVLDGNHRLAMAIGCSAPVSRSTEEQVDTVRRRLVEVTAQMSQKLGA